MRITAVTLVRNEADILEPFIEWTRRLVDRHLVIDHASTDGSRDVLDRLAAEDEAVQVSTYPYQSYRQDQIMTGVLRGLSVAPDEWFLLLDADEFLDVDKRDTLVELLSGRSAEIVHFAWRNLAPTELGTFDQFRLEQPYWEACNGPKRIKCAIRGSWLIANPGAWIEQGNHAVRRSLYAEPEVGREVGRLLHLPVRSIERLRFKLTVGLDAYRPIRAQRPGQGSHWSHLQDVLDADTFASDVLIRAVCRYGEELSVRELSDMAASGFQLVPPSELPPLRGGSPPEALPLLEVRERERVQVWRDEPVVPGALALAEIQTNGLIAMRPVALMAEGRERLEAFAKLTVRPPLSPGEVIAAVPKAMEAASERPNKFVPSAWSAHSPFLRFLMVALNVRRYAELGVHAGMSLFSAAQAAAHISHEVECVGIDTWEGDAHAGHYDEGVFHDFRADALEAYPEHVTFIRARFEEALPLFAEGSIDLLHIDGLHTYEAVSEDFEQWVGKVRNGGVVLLHDTKVFESDFGVWRFWEELEATYASLDIWHSHGLGVLLIGDVHPQIAKFLNVLKTDVDALTAFNGVVRAIGQMSVAWSEDHESLQEAKERLAAQSRVPLVPAESDVNAEVAGLRAERDELRRMLHEALTSRSWRMTAPLRAIRRG